MLSCFAGCAKYIGALSWRCSHSNNHDTFFYQPLYLCRCIRSIAKVPGGFKSGWGEYECVHQYTLFSQEGLNNLGVVNYSHHLRYGPDVYAFVFESISLFFCHSFLYSLFFIFIVLPGDFSQEILQFFCNQINHLSFIIGYRISYQTC